MVDTPLTDIRADIESLSSESGKYYLVCARTGVQPVPAAGQRFTSRERARAGARAVERYRAALRRYDPRAPRHDVIVCKEHVIDREPATVGGEPA